MADKSTGYANLFLNGDSIAALRSDINQATWERGVLFQLKNLIDVPPFYCSRAVMNALTRNGKKTVIKPFGPTAQDPLNAYAQPTNWQAATPNGKDQLYCGDDPSTPINDTGLKIPGTPKGTGTGSDIIVSYTAQDWVPQANDPGRRPDEILLHELVHGLRQQRGQLQCVATATVNNQMYDTVEELYAVVVSNIYRSECGYKVLRADHHGFKKLEAPLNDEKKFYQRWKTELDRFTTEMSVLSVHLSVVPCAFNPIRVAMNQKFKQNDLVDLHNTLNDIW
jgi:hypothetical protein